MKPGETVRANWLPWTTRMEVGVLRELQRLLLAHKLNYKTKA